MIPAGILDKVTPHTHRCLHCRAAWVHGTPWCAAAVEYRCSLCALFLHSLTSPEGESTYDD